MKKDNISSTFLVTGGSGMLGSAVASQLREAKFKVIAPTHNEMDVTRRESGGRFSKTSLDWIIHCAAPVNADWCEENPSIAYDTIIEGTQLVIELAKKTDARILYPQSFLIFDGQTNPIMEDTPPQPLSVYGACKYLAEQMVLAQVPDSLVIRMGGFFGGDRRDKNFVGKIIPVIRERCSAGETLLEVGDRIWQPTYTEDLARNCITLIQNNKSGIYNMASHGAAAFWEIAQEITRILKLEDKIKIRKISAEYLGRKEVARRPARAIMNNARLAVEGCDLQRSWQEGLREYLNRDFWIHPV